MPSLIKIIYFIKIQMFIQEGMRADHTFCKKSWREYVPIHANGGRRRAGNGR